MQQVAPRPLARWTLGLGIAILVSQPCLGGWQGVISDVTNCPENSTFELIRKQRVPRDRELRVEVTDDVPIVKTRKVKLLRIPIPFTSKEEPIKRTDLYNTLFVLIKGSKKEKKLEPTKIVVPEKRFEAVPPDLRRSEKCPKAANG